MRLNGDIFPYLQTNCLFSIRQECKWVFEETDFVYLVLDLFENGEFQRYLQSAMFSMSMKQD